MDDRAGNSKQIGRYEVIDEIGSGAYSNVYRARDPLLDREVAIKVMRPFLMSEPEFVVRFQREAKTVANLDHPHIVPVHDHGEVEGQLYLVMKLMPGGSLMLPLARGPIPWEQVVSLTGEMASALDYAHKHGLVHRDIKPENILLDARGQAQVADFGVVKALENSTTQLSMSGGILGSPAYIAPEVWNGQPAAAATDIYALSCLVFEMIAGRKLHNAKTLPAAMALHFRPRQYPEEWPDGTPPGLEKALDRGLAQDPADRYQTAAALAEALASLKMDVLAEPYEALLAAVATEKWPEAVELAESISAQDTDYKDVRQLLAQANEAKAESERLARVSQWRVEDAEAPAKVKEQAPAQKLTAGPAPDALSSAEEHNKPRHKPSVRQSGPTPVKAARTAQGINLSKPNTLLWEGHKIIVGAFCSQKYLWLKHQLFVSVDGVEIASASTFGTGGKTFARGRFIHQGKECALELEIPKQGSYRYLQFNLRINKESVKQGKLYVENWWAHLGVWLILAAIFLAVLSLTGLF